MAMKMVEWIGRSVSLFDLFPVFVFMMRHEIVIVPLLMDNIFERPRHANQINETETLPSNLFCGSDNQKRTEQTTATTKIHTTATTTKEKLPV